MQFLRIINNNNIIVSSYDFVLRTTDETFDDHVFMAPEVAKLYDGNVETDTGVLYNEALSQCVENKLDTLINFLEGRIVEDLEIKNGDLHICLSEGIEIDIFMAYPDSSEMKAYTLLNRKN